MMRDDGRLADVDGPVIVWAAAVSWDDVPGSDRRMVDELARSHHVVWVDPPMSILREPTRGVPASYCLTVSPGVTRVHVVGPPAVTRGIVRAAALRGVGRGAQRIVSRHRLQVAAVIGRPANVAAISAAAPVRVYYVTDDLVAGASLMGLSLPNVTRIEADNVRIADAVVAVSSTLAQRYEGTVGRVAVVPNGCNVTHFAGVDRLPRPPDVPAGVRLAGVVGQLNERLDVDVLLAVADRGVPLLLVGPRADRDPQVGRRLDELIARHNVHWVGAKSYAELPAYLGAITVGITPYVDDEFNRASCPLKTLEYLAAGRPVVASDLPAVRELGTELVHVASSAADFVDHVERVLRSDIGRDRPARRALAARHSWPACADAMLTLVEDLRRPAGDLPHQADDREVTPTPMISR